MRPPWLCVAVDLSAANFCQRISMASSGSHAAGGPRSLRRCLVPRLWTGRLVGILAVSRKQLLHSPVGSHSRDQIAGSGAEGHISLLAHHSIVEQNDCDAILSTII